MVGEEAADVRGRPAAQGVGHEPRALPERRDDVGGIGVVSDVAAAAARDEQFGTGTVETLEHERAAR